MSGAVEIVGQPTLRRNDHWVRSWPLGRSTLVQLATNVALLLAVTSSVGLLFMWYLDQGPVGDADRAVAEWLEDHRTENLNTFTHYGSMLSDTLVKVALVVLTGGAAMLMWRRWHDGVFIALAVIVESTVFVRGELHRRSGPPARGAARSTCSVGQFSIWAHRGGGGLLRRGVHRRLLAHPQPARPGRLLRRRRRVRR